MLSHASRITRYDPPHMFEDAMTAGMFRSFEHQHRFEEHDGGTLMHDRLRLVAPLGPLGLLAERIVLRRYFVRFLTDRDQHIRSVAEGDGWRRYITDVACD